MKNKSPKYSVLFWSSAAILFLVCVFISYFGILKPLDESVLDFHFRNYERDLDNGQVVLITIDSKSLEQARDSLNIYWPWPRDFYAMVHNYLSEKGARVIAYDLFLDQPDFDRGNMIGYLSDKSLAVSMQTYDNTVLPVYASKESYKSDAIDSTFHNKYISTHLNKSKYQLKNLPIEPFLKASKGIGVVTVSGSTIRSIPLLYPVRDSAAIPSFALQTYIAFKGIKIDEIEVQDEQLVIDSLFVDLDSKFEVPINWYNNCDSERECDNSFTTYPFYTILENAALFSQYGQAPEDKLIDVKGKIVIIGATAAGLSDIKSTPLSHSVSTPGVFIHATVIENLLDNGFLKKIEITDYSYLILLVLWLLGTLFFIQRAAHIQSVVVSVFSLLIPVSIAEIMFIKSRIWIPFVETVVFTFLVITTGFVIKYIFEDRNRKQIKKAFAHYLSKDLVNEISENPELLALGGQKKTLTVMFSDLAGFTQYSEQTEPEKLVTFLNDYFTRMTKIIFKTQGTLDKYIGDAIMAFWGAPVSLEDHAYKACKCVLEMEREVRKLNNDLNKSDDDHLKVRFGINTGSVIVGNLGSFERFNYTAVGDHVNLAARLEPACKMFGVNNLISESTYRLVNEKILCKPIGKIKLKGKAQSVQIYQLLCEFDSDEYDLMLKHVEAFKEALEYFYKQNFSESIKRFKILQDAHDDNVAGLYAQESERLINDPPDSEWDGSYVQKSK